jgi:hypothetical protein
MIFVHFYDSSIQTALKKIYPLHQWEEWKFPKVSKHFWDSLYNQRRFFDWLGKQVGVENGPNNHCSLEILDRFFDQSEIFPSQIYQSGTKLHKQIFLNIEPHLYCGCTTAGRSGAL